MAHNATNPPQQRSQPYVFPTVRDVAAYVKATGGLPGVSTSIEQPGMMPTQYVKPNLRMRANGEIVIMGAQTAYFGPLDPLQPQAQYAAAQTIGRAFDYAVGYNTRVTPRTGTPIGFAKLKALAQYDVVAMLISRQQDKLCTKPWAILPIDEKIKPDDRCKKITDDLSMPDKETTWKDWMRELTYQLIVYDAPSIYLRPTLGGQLYGMEIVDGSTITPKIMGNGRTPPWYMGPAYQQVLKGMPAVDYTKPVPWGQRPVVLDGDGAPLPEMIYKPRNPRVDSPYGYSPIEQMIDLVEIGINRQTYLKRYYTEGSTPDLIFECPAEWTNDQIIQFKYGWDALLAGNLSQRCGTMFVPAGAKPLDTKEKALTDQTDEWLIRLFCFALGLSPMPFIKMMNRASGEQHNTEANEEGQLPWQEYFVDLFNLILRLKYGVTDLCFRWEEEEETDPATQTTIDVALVNAKIYHPDEIRAKRGDEAMSPEMRLEMDQANFNAAVNSTVLPDEQQAAENDHALAMQAAKPTPVVAAPGKSDAQKFAEFLELVKRDPAPVPHITVEGPVINAAPVHVHPAAVTVNTPDITLGDTFVDVGATNMQAKFDAPKQAAAGAKSISNVKKNADGSYSATITERASRDVTVAKASQ